MFEYCKTPEKSILIKIGNFLSHEVEWIDENGEFVSCEAVNEWDRYEIAKAFFRTKDNFDYNLIGGALNHKKYINELAQKFDELIPKRYFIKYHQFHKVTFDNTDGTFLNNQYNGKDNHEETKNLIFKFEINETLEMKIGNKAEHFKKEFPATDKQIALLKVLAEEAGYILKEVKEINVSEASKLIAFLLGTESEEPTFLFDFLEYE